MVKSTELKYTSRERLRGDLLADLFHDEQKLSLSELKVLIN